VIQPNLRRINNKMSGNGHPAWQEILKDIPESFHGIVSPVLQKWDQGVQQTLEAKNAELKQYEAFKQFVDNKVDPGWLAEAADFAYRAQENPKELFEHANKVWNLGFVSAEEASSQQTGGESASNLYGDDPELENMDITKHPQFAQLMETVNGLNSKVTEFTQNSENDRQQQQWDSYLKQQHDEGKQFDDTFVTALVANGLSFDDAFERYNSLVASVVGDGSGGDSNDNQAGQSTDTNSGDSTAPVVMGGDASGSGLPTQPISFGNMKSADLEDTVEKMIASLNSQD
jgi:uncharacterized protein YdcH (DUF465 family)